MKSPEAFAMTIAMFISYIVIYELVVKLINKKPHGYRSGVTKTPCSTSSAPQAGAPPPAHLLTRSTPNELGQGEG